MRFILDLAKAVFWIKFTYVGRFKGWRSSPHFSSQILKRLAFVGVTRSFSLEYVADLNWQEFLCHSMTAS